MSGDGRDLDFRVIVPARYAASRLPGKPLCEIAGRPLVAHVLDVAQRAGAREVLVAVDDVRIAEAVEAAGGRALMTSAEHRSGTDRLAEAASVLGWPEDAIVVNLQGDEPLVPPRLVADLARALHGHPQAGIATLATRIETVDEVFEPSVVKVVLDDDGYASYFSRAPIPWVRDWFAAAERPAALPPDVPFLRHLGLYAYRVGTLHRLAATPPSTHERAESLEQLRALAIGVRIHVTPVAEPPPRGVDTEADLERTRQVLEAALQGASR